MDPPSSDSISTATSNRKVDGFADALGDKVGAPVVMISGVSHPVTEFETPYRVTNDHTCDSCWNDPTLRFDSKDFPRRPRRRRSRGG